MSFEVQLELFRGPVDLLLYLVRRDELSVTELPLAKITEQYCEYLEILEELNVDEVGEFIEVAAFLLELKARNVLPQPKSESEELWQQPHQQIVQRLLEYKRIRDAASVLEERSRQWQTRYPRLVQDESPRWVDPATQPIEQVELWDLVSAFGRILRDNRAVQPSSIVYDETPIQVYMERILERVRRRPKVAFSDLFAPGMHKSAMIGVFLAVLELVRHHKVKTEQRDTDGEIWLYLEHPSGRDDGAGVLVVAG
ncbi:MAG: segregation/condensation protein A [Pirellulaceae bacterium]|nr:MAG: segregation/condensation protein A [Pirellulaceae bacterium]